MARWTASAKWAAGPALDGQRATPLVLSLTDELGVTALTQKPSPARTRNTETKSDAGNGDLGNAATPTSDVAKT